MAKWKHTLRLGDVFHNDDLTLAQKTEKITERFQALKIPEADRWDAESTLEELADAAAEDDVDWWDGAWNFFYDWADANRVWVETRG